MFFYDINHLKKQESKRAKHFIVMYLKCKKCDDLIYNVVIVRKPEPNEPIILAVERSVEHDPIVWSG